MLYPQSPLYERLLAAIAAMPVVDCHEHMFGPEGRPKYTEPIAALVHWYYSTDLAVATFGVREQEIQGLMDPEVPTDEKWPLFERLWRASEHTAYARVTKLVLKHVYGEEERQPLSRATLERVAGKLAGMDEARYFRLLDEANIQAILSDVLEWLPQGLESFLDGRKTFPPRWRPLISLPAFHPTTFNWATVQTVGRLLDRHITSLEEYLEAVYSLFEKMVALGAVGIKDQSAYNRSIAYALVPRAEAEKQFNQVLSDPVNSLGWPAGQPLNDFLFHEFMRFAGQLKLPVQLHTGQLASVYGRVERANAAGLATALELHRGVRFDLFHGNWPYMGDLLFLGRNYPNVSIDLCWLHIIDPAYAIELMQRAVLTMPHTKMHAFGGDYGDVPEFTLAHLQIARQNIAAALAGLVEGGWLSQDQALSIARDWLYNNPNRFFDLGLPDLDG
ncbi:MAG: amidohydrolase family protein [Chloroflexota bacterium]